MINAKYRGLRTDGKGWVYGLLRKQRQRELYQQASGVSYTGEWEYWIDSHEGNHGSWLVTPETVGQYTGLKDKNGVDIYEGDRTNEGVVAFENGCFMLVITDKYEPFKDMKQRLYFTHANQEVISNIHEKGDE